MIRWRRFWVAMSACAAVAGITGRAVATEITPGRQQALRHLLAQDCGSCHGLTLKGGLGPPLTREALAGKPAMMLREVILHGRPGTPMPPWKPFLSETEADWLVELLLTGRTNER